MPFSWKPGRGHKDPNMDFSFEILKVFRSDSIDPKNTIDLMAICWKRAGTPVLEKRRVWHSKKGEIRLRKLVGMNTEDINFILQHGTEIVDLLRVKQETENGK